MSEVTAPSPSHECDIRILIDSHFMSQPTYEKVNEELFLDNPLHVTLNNSKLAHRIYVILIANKELINKLKKCYEPNSQ
jgi:hypothetical protein